MMTYAHPPDMFPCLTVLRRSSCSSELARRSQTDIHSSLRDSLRSVAVLVYATCAGEFACGPCRFIWSSLQSACLVLAFFICLMCMYQQVICRTECFRVFTAFMFGGGFPSFSPKRPSFSHILFRARDAVSGLHRFLHDSESNRLLHPEGAVSRRARCSVCAHHGEGRAKYRSYPRIKKHVPD